MIGRTLPRTTRWELFRFSLGQPFVFSPDWQTRADGDVFSSWRYLVNRTYESYWKNTGHMSLIPRNLKIELRMFPFHFKGTILWIHTDRKLYIAELPLYCQKSFQASRSISIKPSETTCYTGLSVRNTSSNVVQLARKPCRRFMALNIC